MARPKTDSVRVNIYIPRKILAVMKNMAERRGMTYSEITRAAIIKHLREELEREKSGNL